MRERWFDHFLHWVTERYILAFVIFCLGLSGLAGLAWTHAHKPVINADVMDLVEDSKLDPAVSQSINQLRQKMERQHVWIVADENHEGALTAAQFLRKALQQSNLYQSVGNLPEGASLAAFGKFYFPYHSQLLSPESRQRLDQATSQTIVQQTIQSLYSPIEGASASLLQDDPFLLFPDYLKSLAPRNSELTYNDGFMVGMKDGKTYVLIFSELAKGPFNFAFQDAVFEFKEQAQAQIASRFPTTTLKSVGVFEHARFATDSARSEIGLVGGGSLALSILMTFLTFRSLRPLLAASVTLAAGLLGGFSFCLLLFGNIHLLALIGGSTLIGIATDYAVHFLAYRLRTDRAWHMRSALRHVLPVAFLGLVTTIFGLGGLLGSGFLALQQIAVFTGGGLVWAFLSLALAYPLLLRNWDKAACPPAFLRLAGAWGKLWSTPRTGLWGLPVVFAAVAVTIVMALPHLRFNDDIRLLTAVPSHLENEEKELRQIVGAAPDSRFLVITGSTPEDLLRHEEQLALKLQAQQKSGNISDYMMLSRFVPSQQQQTEDYHRIRRLIHGDTAAVTDLAAEIGLAPKVVTSLQSLMAPEKPAGYLTPELWLQQPQSASLRHLWLGEVDGGVASVATLSGLISPEKLKETLKTTQNVHLVDSVATVSDYLKQARERAMLALAVAVGAISLILLIRYGLVGGLATMFVPVVSCVATLSLLVLLGEPLSLFHIIGFSLVLGMAVDYVIFLRSEDTHNTVFLSVLLAVLSTEASFGLLSLSKTPAVHGFGLTVALGIAIAFSLAPIANFKFQKGGVASWGKS